jgi:ribonuclease Z
MLEVGGTQLRAVSVGGLETCIEVPAWKLSFDIGRCPPSAVRLPRVLFTHAHVDHMGGVATHCALRALNGLSPPEYVIPSSDVEAFTDLMNAWRRLDRSDLPCSVRSMSPGAHFDLGPRRRVIAFRAVHRVPTLGYALCTVQTRLRERYRGLAGAELGRLRQAGESLDDVRQTPEVVFCGDTTIDVVEREPIVRRAKLLILEVTFLDDRVSVERARTSGHVHLDELVDRAELFADVGHLLLTHVSARYGPGLFKEIVERRLPTSLLERVTCLPAHTDWISGPA